MAPKSKHATARRSDADFLHEGKNGSDEIDQLGELLGEGNQLRSRSLTKHASSRPANRKRLALEQLVKFMSKEGKKFLTLNKLNAFYKIHPTYKGFITKKSVTIHGQEAGLEWKCNAPNIDEIHLCHPPAPIASSTGLVSNVLSSAQHAATATEDNSTRQPMLLGNAPVGASKYVEFSSDGRAILSDDPPPSPSAGAGANVDAVDPKDLERLEDILPANLRGWLSSFPMDQRIVEIVLDLGRSPLVHYMASATLSEEDGGSNLFLSDFLEGEEVSRATLDEICASDTLGKFTSDNRAGINDTLHRVSRKLNRSNEVIGLTIRVGRMTPGSIRMITDVVASRRSVLLLGVPGAGKTTLLREYARVLADAGTRVEIVDTSNEIAGDGDVPHCSVGRARRMMVNNRHEQHKVMIEAVQNHMPQCIVVDEVGTVQEAVAAEDIAQRGVQLVATLHGTQLQDLLQNPQLRRLVGGVQTVVMGDGKAAERGSVNKSVRERQGVPVFDTIIELRNHHTYVIYHNIAKTVDTMLADKLPVFEIRSLDVATGGIRVTNANAFAS